MASKKKPAVTSKITKPKKKQPLTVEIALQQRQKELELINKKLAQSQVELEAAYRQYSDLYDFAPVGYFTLTRNGAIHQVNLAGANLLGVHHNEATRLRLTAFISSESRPAFNVFFEKLLSGEGKETCELALKKKENGKFWVRLEATCFEGGAVCRAMLADITEHKWMEQILQESENRFRMLLQDVSTVAVQGYAIDGTTQYWNSASERLYGYSKQEAIGRSLLDLIIPLEMRSEVRQAIQQMGETGQPIPAAELSLMRKDNSRVTVYSSHAIVSIPGRAPELFCLDIDLTERKRVEDLLKESEWRTRIVSELTTDYIFVVDVDPSGILKFRWASDNLFRITGRTIEEVETSDVWGSIIHPDDRSRFFGFINQILSTAEVGELECRAFLKHGEERWVRIFARPQVGEGKSVTIIVGAIQDITERKHAEEALKASTEFANDLIASMQDGVSVLDKNGVHLDVNSAMCHITGFSREELIGSGTPHPYWPPEEYEHIQVAFQRTLANEFSNFEMMFMRKNGERFPASVSPFAIKDNLGNIISYAATIKDITDRKRTEQALEAANRELQTALTLQQQLAHTDALTGINNRRHLYELAEHEFEIAMRYQQPLSAIMFDIDHFKEVNDTFGHAIGDQILQRVTQVACAELRSADVIGRYGGEEFVIILPMTNAKQAYPLAERIRAGVAAIHVPTEKRDAAVTLSIGIVEMIHGAQNESAETLIRRADEAMYAAKQAGRNRTEIGQL